jgi:hypothetical protein
VPDFALDPQTITRALNEVVARAEAEGIVGTIEVFGGSALVMLYPHEAEVRATEDVDARIRTNASLTRIIEEVGEKLGLAPNWLNSRSDPFLPATVVASPASKLIVTFATARQLIAAKMSAARPQDLHDLGILVKHEGIRTPEELVDIAFDAYGDDSVVLTDTREESLLFARDVFARAKKIGLIP